MQKTISITKTDTHLKGRYKLPASKSISNRLLIINALSLNGIEISNPSTADDTLLLQKLLSIVKFNMVQGKVVELDAGNAGTTYRFLTALLSITPGKWMLTGSERMKQRPVGVLVEALQSLGASISYLAKPGYPPLLIEGKSLKGNEVTIDTSVSSQFTSALMLIGPVLSQGIKIRFKGKTVSASYMDMTSELMKMCGIRINTGKKYIRVLPGEYQTTGQTVEADWSAAAFWYEAVALADEADIFLEGLQKFSLQGDSILPGLFSNFGVVTDFHEDGIRLRKVMARIDGFFYDFTHHPDLAQAVIATCAGLGIRGRFEGLESLIIKETDRLRAMKNEIEKIGIKVNYSPDFPQSKSLDIEPGKNPFPFGLSFETYCDHRMAMAIAPLAIKGNFLKLRNPDVVTKSYPDFWDHLESAGFIISPL